MSHPNLNLDPNQELDAEGNPKTLPPNPGPSNDPTKDPAFLMESAREAHKAARIANDRTSLLEQELAALKAAAKGDDSKLTDFVPPTKDEYWNDPVQGTTAVVKKLLEDAIGPLREQLKPVVETARNLTRDGNLNAAKARFRGDARFKVIFANPSAEGLLDEWLLKAPEVNDSVVMQYLYSIMGGIATGEIKVTSNTPTPPETIPPSGPPPRDREKPASTRPLTEEEKALARRYNLTDAKFLQIYDTADEVSFAQIDDALKPAKKD